MSDTFHKVALAEGGFASARRLRVLARLASLRLHVSWTPAVACATLAGSFFFAWALFRILLILVFPGPSSY
jgi:hypothetical protein